MRHRSADRHNRGAKGGGPNSAAAQAVYAALDLGTNNCRLLIARPPCRDAAADPADPAYRVVNTFSNIVRLGEGLDRSGVLGDDAMDRTIAALKICAGRLTRFDVTRSRCVTTAACRRAENGVAFLKRVHEETGLQLDVISGEEEARLAIAGCAGLLDGKHRHGLVVDIGGGSTELVWLDLTDRAHRIKGWLSLPFGVVTFAEKYGGDRIPRGAYRTMVEEASAALGPFERAHRVREKVQRGEVQMLGTSGTVTTLAACQKGLRRYDRRKIDGVWLGRDDIRALSAKLAAMTCDQRTADPCIGPGRADLVVAGCAILEAINDTWPCSRLRVADRGVREGVIALLMREDTV